jgi:hypothetical protein
VICQQRALFYADNSSALGLYAVVALLSGWVFSVTVKVSVYWRRPKSGNEVLGNSLRLDS